jgi:geranylgeranyl diphosphate synthase type II
MSPPSPAEAAADHVAALRARVDDALPGLVADREPAVLYEPVRHVLEGGGKRVRPTVLLLVAEAFGVRPERALPAALAVEVFHNFTLVHDDIMDEADERRGRPTVHVKWDTGTAILVGDLLMGLSYDLLGQVDGADTEALYDVYHPMVEQLCMGQALDASFEEESDVSVDAYLEMIDGKTAALLAAAFELGALLGGAPPADRRNVREAGRLVGRAFQVQDDLLDLTADGDEWGKAVGGDLVTGKKTFLTLRALERADGEEHDWFARLTDGGLPPADVPEARDRMERLGVFSDARAAVERYTEEARDRLRVLPDGRATDTLHWLLDEMEARSH